MAKNTANNYDASSITVLEGLEAVRVRPGMYIGSVSTKGLNHLIYEIMDNAVDEHLAGFCSTIHVTLEADGSATVSDNGRGIPVGMLLGLLSAKGILRAVFNQLSPEMFLAQDTAQLETLMVENGSGKWGYLVVSIVVTLFFAFLAAAPAAHFAAKVSPVAAMRNISSVKRRDER